MNRPLRERPTSSLRSSPSRTPTTRCAVAVPAQMPVFDLFELVRAHLAVPYEVLLRVRPVEGQSQRSSTLLLHLSFYQLVRQTRRLPRVSSQAMYDAR